MRLAQPGQRGREHGLRGGNEITHAQLRALATRLTAQLSHGGFVVGDEGAHRFHERMAKGGGLHAAGLALQQFAADLVFQSLHLAAQGGLGDAQPHCGAVDAAFLDHGEQGADAVHHASKGMRVRHNRKVELALPDRPHLAQDVVL